MQSNWPHLRGHWPQITLVAVGRWAILTANFTTTVNHGAVGHHIRLDTWHWSHQTNPCLYKHFVKMSTRYVISWKLGLDCSWPRAQTSGFHGDHEFKGPWPIYSANSRSEAHHINPAIGILLQPAMENTSKAAPNPPSPFVATPYLETCDHGLKKTCWFNGLCLNAWKIPTMPYWAIDLEARSMHNTFTASSQRLHRSDALIMLLYLGIETTTRPVPIQSTCTAWNSLQFLPWRQRLFLPTKSRKGVKVSLRSSWPSSNSKKLLYCPHWTFKWRKSSTIPAGFNV